MLSLATAPVHPHGTRVIMYPVLEMRLIMMLKKVSMQLFCLSYPCISVAIVRCQCYDIGSHDYEMDKNGYLLSGSLLSVGLSKIVRRELSQKIH